MARAIFSKWCVRVESWQVSPMKTDRRSVAFGRIAGFLLLIVWLAGLAKFILSGKAIAFVMPFQSEHPLGIHNLGLYRYGPEIRASSYYADIDNQHHPAFLVDGLSQPSVLEKWSSSPQDAHPWVEIRWNKPALLKHVKIHHPGATENLRFTSRLHSLSCIFTGETMETRAIKNQQLSVAEHQIGCDHAIGVKLLIDPPPNEKIVRVYELEAWGELEPEAAR